MKSDLRTATGTPHSIRGQLILALTATLTVLGAVLAAGSFATFGHNQATHPEPAAKSDSEDPDRSIDRSPQDTGSVAGEARFVALPDAEAWARLPDRTAGEAGRLPAWALVLARTLPRTAAAMLELDYIHRAGSQLGLDLRGLIRWAAARAGHSAYGEAYALADLRAAGPGKLADRLAAGDRTGLEPGPLAVMAFADQMTADPRKVTDAEVATLIGQYGERQVVAIVLLLAYAQFQDRMAIALGLSVEPEGPAPPLAVRFAKRPFGIAAAPPPRRPATGPITSRAPDGPPPADWRATGLDLIRCSLDEQRNRRPRIRLRTS